MTGGDRVEADRIAQLLVDTPDGPRRGSGYRITATKVLTADHVVRGATSVRVRFADWTADGTTWVGDEDSDLAVLTIGPRPGERPLEPVVFGEIGPQAAVLPVRAVGFPRFKLRDGRYRDSHQADGTAAALSNRREGTLEITVPPPAPDPDASPWQGMSGAAVWVGTHLVGVIAKHHPADGLGRLAAIRIETARTSREVGKQLGIGRFTPLDPVRPNASGEATLSAYRAQVEDIAPLLLTGRGAILADLARFCAGDKPYLWWQAGPWAGKSALLSTFALNPPDGVDVVSFFVTARLPGQSDGTAYLTAVIDQLRALTGEPVRDVAGPARWGEALRLLALAAARSVGAGRRLVLVVDGLDEDTGGAEAPSIASYLPRRLPEGVRVIVAGRPHPDLPDDVPEDHPLRACDRRELVPFEGAVDHERRARAELAAIFRRDGVHRALLGLVTASGGGLGSSDLAEMAGLAPFEVWGMLAGLFGRTFRAWSGSASFPHGRERVYLFAHETLRDVAVTLFGNTLSAYSDTIDGWARGYRERGWPQDTPRYLLGSYIGHLAQTDRTGQLVDMTTDPARHDRMLVLTGGDGLALGQIASAQEHLLRAAHPDLTALLRLSLERDRLTDRHQHMPVGLPAAWAALGQVARAESLARSLTEPASRVKALALLVLELDPGHPRAQRLTTEVRQGAWLLPPGEAWAAQRVMRRTHRTGSSTSDQIVTFRGVAVALETHALGRTGQSQRVLGLVRRFVVAGSERRQILSLLAELAPPGDGGRGGREEGRAGGALLASLVVIAVALTRFGDHAEAADLLERIETHVRASAVPRHVAGYLAQAARLVPERSRDLLAKAVASVPLDAVTQRSVVAGALACGHPDVLAPLHDELTVHAWASIAAHHAGRGDDAAAEAVVARLASERARVAARIEIALARGAAEELEQWSDLPVDLAVRLVVALAATGRADHAADLFATLHKDHGGSRDLAPAYVAIGDHDRAEELVSGGPTSSEVIDVVIGLARRGDRARAYRIASTRVNGHLRARALGIMAAHAPDSASARRWLAEALLAAPAWVVFGDLVAIAPDAVAPLLPGLLASWGA